MTPDDPPLRVGVIGLGLRARLALEAHRPEQNVHIVAASDISEDRLQQARSWFGKEVACFQDYRKMLSEGGIDVVLVLSPDHFHKEHAIAALKAHKAVFLEKPMATTTADCDEILCAAARTGQKLYVGHNMRFMDFVLKMKWRIARGDIGEVKTAWCRHFIAYGGDAFFRDWHAERAKTNSLLVQKACHDLDVLHWLCGGYSVRVNALGSLMVYNQTGNRRKPNEQSELIWDEANWPPLSQTRLNHTIDVEDVSMLQARLSNGVLVCYQQCHFTPDAWRNYTVIGTEGRLENIGYETIRLWNRRQDKYWDGDLDVTSSYDSSGHGGADTLMMSEFLQYVRAGAPTRNSPVTARYAVATTEAATESLRSDGAPMDIPALPPNIAAAFSRLGNSPIPSDA